MFSHFRGDLLGGITAGIVALPLALAFGVQSGLGPDAGLYGAIFIGFFASLFGGTNTQISGPTAPMTAVSMVVIAGIIASNNGNVEQALPYILIVFLLAGLFQVVLGLIGLGKYIKYIPYPVVSGFMTAIGVIILITQILPALGYYVEDDADYVNQYKPEAKEIVAKRIIDEDFENNTFVYDNPQQTLSNLQGLDETAVDKEALVLAKSNASGVIGALKTLPRAFNKINWLEFGLAMLTVFIIFGFKRITTTIPSTLVALLAVSLGAYFLNVDYRPIEEIPSGFPMPNFEIFTSFSFSQISPYIFTALTLALLGAIDSLLTSVVADNMTKTKHKPNRELVGQGIGNSVASLFGGIPGAGATIRTVVNINSGGKTKLSGMIAAILLLIVLLALGPIASKIPAAVLAGILITVGIGVMDYKGLKAIPNMPKAEVVIMITVLVLSAVWNLVYAVGVGLLLASLIFMKKMGDYTASQSKVTSMGESNEIDEPWPDEGNFPKNLREEVFVKRLEGPLFFGSTTGFQNLSTQVPSSATHIILRMGKVPYIDQSGLYALEDILFDLTRRNVKVFIVGLKKQPEYLIRKIDIIPDLVPEDHLFDTIRSSFVFIDKNVKDRY
ncbi:SulP family inorganic anion transporter [Croceibacter atlanticus]|uniref:SulP family inorganic anion transporter n=1 Tax=Croceibacter atlanticus TaxID=313588 RepID=UPI0030FCC966